MDQSPAVPTPAKGDPITAEWAQKVAEAANAVPNTPEAVGAFASPFGSVTPAQGLPMLGDGGIPAPFECRLFIPSGENATHLYCFLPPFGTGGGIPTSYVYFNGWRSNPKNQTHTGWMDFGALSVATRYWLVLSFYRDDNPDATGLHPEFKWRLELQSGAGTSTPSLPSWADADAPVVVIATVRIPSGSGAANTTNLDGLVQYVRGSLNIGDGWGRAENYERNWCYSIGDSAKALAILLDSTATFRELVGDWMADGVFNIGNAGAFKYKGATYAPKTISYTDGNGDPQSVTVLAQQ